MNCSALKTNLTDKKQSDAKAAAFFHALVQLDSKCGPAGFYYEWIHF